MASSFDSWLTVAEMKEELRLDAADTWHDQLIQRHIEAAVSWCSVAWAVALIDRPVKLPFVLANWNRGNFLLRVPWVVVPAGAGYSVSYIDQAGALQTVDVSGQRLAAHRGSPARLLVSDPAGGWPEAQESKYYLSYTEGVPEDHAHAKRIKQAVVLAAREFYNGSRELTGNHVLSTFISARVEEYA